MLRAYLDLLRPANVATALGDILAGFGVAGLANGAALPWLLISSACLYAGGVVLNDVFDRQIDASERPERPLPSGRIRVRDAAALGGLLLVMGIGAAASAGPLAAIVGSSIALAVLSYDAVTKPHPIAGPLNMGVCRGLNLALGMSGTPEALATYWPLCLISTAYIAGVTLLSRGEVAGGRALAAALATAVVVMAVVAVAAVALRGPHPWAGLALAGVLGVRVIPGFVRAFRVASADVIRTAVKTGVLSLVLLDAALAASFAGLGYSVIVLAVALGAGWLARSFAVT